MVRQILLNDLKRNKTITGAIFIFNMFSALLLVIGINIFLLLNNSVNTLFEKANVPHFIQYHSGDVDKTLIENWAKQNGEIDKYQLQEILNIPGSNVYMNSSIPQSDTVMELLFVNQSEKFDYLLNLNYEIIKLKSNEIAVPIYYKQQKKLKIGDKVIVEKDKFSYEFIIKNFVRDAQMNPAIISSKRFVISREYYEKLEKHFEEKETLIAFRLDNTDNLNEFAMKYSLSKLPQKGPTIDFKLLRVANSLTDGLIAAVIIFVSIFINLISLLSLNFILKLTLERDYKEIGILKAIGVSLQDIQKIYLIKYFFTIAFSNILGYIIAQISSKRIFSRSDSLIGQQSFSIIDYLIPVVILSIISLLIIAMCNMIFRRFNSISTIEMLRSSKVESSNKRLRKFQLNRCKKININLFFALRDQLLKPKLYLLMAVVYALSIFIITIPLNFLNTIKSPEFITYMGMGKSDLILSMRQSSTSNEEFRQIKKSLENDERVLIYNPLITSRYELINSEGNKDNIYLVTGDPSVFPLKYLYGDYPKLQNEIAISYLISKDTEKGIGESLEIIVEDEIKEFIISGIYQDITNGGKSAFAKISPDYTTVSWYTINVDAKKEYLYDIKLDYEKEFENLKVHNTKDSFEETFSYITDKLEILLIISIALIIVVIVLITSLFLKVIIIKDLDQIIIKKSIGISSSDIKKEYLIKMLMNLNIAIIFGTIISNQLGENILSFALSIVGAPKIELVIDTMKSYFIAPLIMIILVSLFTFINIKVIDKVSFDQLIEE